jgi:hypothetical protein
MVTVARRILLKSDSLILVDKKFTLINEKL